MNISKAHLSFQYETSEGNIFEHELPAVCLDMQGFLGNDGKFICL